MKKILLSVTLVPALSFGQITLDNTHFPVAGDQLIMSTLLDPTVDYATTGANYTWDFSTLTPASQRVTNCRPMSEASQLSNIFFGSFAPAAYKASYFSPTTDLPIDQLTASFPVSIDEISTFTKSAPAALTTPGYEFIFSGQGIPVKSDTIETRYVFPLEYGDSWSSRGYTDLDMNPIYDAQWIQHRYRESEVDGWGTITTPYGTYNALRIHHRVLETDSLYLSINGNGTWIPIPIPEAHEYEWRAAEEKEAVFRVRTSVVLGTETVTMVEYRDDYNGLGIEEEQLDFAVYPNPAQDELFVQSTAAIRSVQLLNQQGQVVKVIDAKKSFAATAGITDLEAGMYYVMVTSEAGTRTKLFVKQ
jgi:hypothetical protein